DRGSARRQTLRVDDPHVKERRAGGWEREAAAGGGRSGLDARDLDAGISVPVDHPRGVVVVGELAPGRAGVVPERDPRDRAWRRRAAKNDLPAGSGFILPNLAAQKRRA